MNTEYRVTEEQDCHLLKRLEDVLGQEMHEEFDIRVLVLGVRYSRELIEVHQLKSSHVVKSAVVAVQHIKKLLVKALVVRGATEIPPDATIKMRCRQIVELFGG